MPSCSYAPGLLVLALNLDGIRIFKEPKAPCTGPFLSTVLFMLAEFFLLTNCPLYPNCLRKLWGCGRIFIQFVITEYLFEFILIEVWFPMEDATTSFMTSLIDSVEQTEGLEILKPVMEMLKCESSAIVASYFLSTFCLIAVLHATKLIDVRILDCGLAPFVQDVCRRLTQFFKFFPCPPNAGSCCDPTRQPNLCIRNSSGNCGGISSQRPSRKNLDCMPEKVVHRGEDSDESEQWTGHCGNTCGGPIEKKYHVYKEKTPPKRKPEKYYKESKSNEKKLGCPNPFDVTTCDTDSDQSGHWERQYSDKKGNDPCKKKPPPDEDSDCSEQWGCGKKC